MVKRAPFVTMDGSDDVDGMVYGKIRVDCENMNKSEQDKVVGIGKYARRTSLRWTQ